MIRYAIWLILAIPWTYSQMMPDDTWIEESRLNAGVPLPGDGFGNSVAIYRETAVVGAPDIAKGTGSAYVFRYDSQLRRWIEEARLIADHCRPYDHFGASASLHRDTAIIGAWGRDEESGAAYIFRYHPQHRRWLEEAVLTASDRRSGNYFGYSVALYDHLAIIGAPRDSTHGEAAGAAYVFRYHPEYSYWKEEARLIASDAGPQALFGNDVGIYENTVVIGAYGENSNGYGAGAAYVFCYDRRREQWSEQAKLTASDAEAVDSFGFAVDVHGDMVLIGANGADVGKNGTGAAYVFCRHGNLWKEEARLIASDAEDKDWYGNAVDIHGEIAVIGAYGESEEGKQAGAVYVVRYDSLHSEWVEEMKLTAADAQVGDRFGRALSLHDGRIIAGSRSHIPSVPGVAYIFAERYCK